MSVAVVGSSQFDSLVSHRYSMSTWSDLDTNDVLNVHQLKSPRVRRGPEDEVEDQHFLSFHPDHVHSVRRVYGRENRDAKITGSSWENVVVCNLSYQELQSEYQKNIFSGILEKLVHTKEAYLLHNHIKTLLSANLPNCEVLDASYNWLVSFADLPNLPKLKRLILSANNIQNLNHLGKLRNCSQLRYMDLRLNPVVFQTFNYRFQVFKILPQLEYLDGVRKKAVDLTPLPVKNDDFKNEKCTIL